MLIDVNKILNYREKNNLSQSKLASDLGFTRQKMNLIEKNETAKPDDIKKIEELIKEEIEVKLTKEEIRKYREKYKLTQDDLAEKCGLTKRSISKLENSEKIKTLQQHKKLIEIIKNDYPRVVYENLEKEIVIIEKEKEIIFIGNIEADPKAKEEYLNVKENSNKLIKDKNNQKGFYANNNISALIEEIKENNQINENEIKNIIKRYLPNSKVMYKTLNRITIKDNKIPLYYEIEYTKENREVEIKNINVKKRRINT